MNISKLRLILIIIGILIVLFSNNLFEILYPHHGEIFEITKTFSFIFIGLIFVLIGLFFNFDSFIDE